MYYMSSVVLKIIQEELIELTVDEEAISILDNVEVEVLLQELRPSINKKEDTEWPFSCTFQFIGALFEISNLYVLKRRLA